MGFDWEAVLDAHGERAAEAYDEAASDALYQDHPSAAPATRLSGPVDRGDDEIDPPIDEV